jgi:ligand-binding sensor protein
MKTTPDTKNSVTYTLNDIHFGDIFILEDIQRLQDLFADTHGVASIITHPDGSPITNPSNFCRLCNNIIRKSEKGLANCFKSDALIGCHNPSGSVMQQCLS